MSDYKNNFFSDFLDSLRSKRTESLGFMTLQEGKHWTDFHVLQVNFCDLKKGKQVAKEKKWQSVQFKINSTI